MSEADIEGLRRFSEKGDRGLSPFFVGRAAEFDRLSRRCANLLEDLEGGPRRIGPDDAVHRLPRNGEDRPAEALRADALQPAGRSGLAAGGAYERPPASRCRNRHCRRSRRNGRDDQDGQSVRRHRRRSGEAPEGRADAGRAEGAVLQGQVPSTAHLRPRGRDPERRAEERRSLDGTARSDLRSAHPAGLRRTERLRGGAAAGRHLRAGRRSPHRPAAAGRGRRPRRGAQAVRGLPGGRGRSRQGAVDRIHRRRQPRLPRSICTSASRPPPGCSPAAAGPPPRKAAGPPGRWRRRQEGTTTWIG